MHILVVYCVPNMCPLKLLTIKRIERAEKGGFSDEVEPVLLAEDCNGSDKIIQVIYNDINYNS